MPRLPRVSGAEAVRILEQLGFAVVRQRGSHIVMRRGAVSCVIPNHPISRSARSRVFFGRREFLPKSLLQRDEAPKRV